MKVLGIETSCDETGIALYDSEAGLLAHVLYSQIALHQAYGGVVPELASRDHVRTVLPLIEQTLREADCTLKDVDGIAYTAGPGLVGALLVGASIGRSLAYGLGIPSVAVHHMEGHLLAPFLEKNPPDFPFVALLVSGGHTQLFMVKALGQYHLLGESMDDAAGEAFDKTAKLLGLPYPGGPQLALLATKGRPGRFTFPKPMTHKRNLQFSFSGLKTAVRAAVTAEKNLDDQTKADIAYAFEQAVVETLVIKCRWAIEESGFTRLVVAGGVSANLTLRDLLTKAMAEKSVEVFYPRHTFCTDNGAMIAFAGCKHLERGERAALAIEAKARWVL